MIELQQVTKTFKNHMALRSVSLKLESNKTHVFIGQSGSGKSTLLRIVAGLLSPDQGRVFLNGQESRKISGFDRAKIYGFMIQDGGLFPHLTCRENILLPSLVHRLSPDEANKRYETLAQMVGLSSDILGRFPRQVSGGQRQRVALVRALILDPPLIFLDEPLGALDPIVKADLHKQLRRIFRQLQKTAIVVTHDLAEAAYFGDTLTLLNEGVVEQHGPLEDFLKQPTSQFVREYFSAQKPPPSLKQLVEEGDA